VASPEPEAFSFKALKHPGCAAPESSHCGIIWSKAGAILSAISRARKPHFKLLLMASGLYLFIKSVPLETHFALQKQVASFSLTRPDDLIARFFPETHSL
jgi:hypothetical protein